jgi:hypothetical protein
MMNIGSGPEPISGIYTTIDKADDEGHSHGPIDVSAPTPHSLHMNDRELFGPAAACRDLRELIQLQQSSVGDEAARAIAAYGMLVTARSAPKGDSIDDALEVLNLLGAAKAELDKGARHDRSTVSVTATVLAGAQQFFDEATIGCTEWPTPGEIVDRVSKHVAEFAFAGPWKRMKLGSGGEVVGVETFHP